MTSIVLNSFEDARVLKEEVARSQNAFFEEVKRFQDLVFSVLLGLILTVLIPFVALIVKLESPGPIFFRQKRVGKDGKIFQLLKFRSTYRTSVDETIGWRKDEENVYTKFGKFLRKSYIDELPQIINIWKGEMSLIGPRPERPEFVEVLKKAVPHYELRLLMRPGITGWAQINMENDAAAEDAQEKLNYDLYYIKHRSPWLDLKIALKTSLLISQRRGR